MALQNLSRKTTSTSPRERSSCLVLEGYQLLCFDHFHHFNHGSPPFYLFDWFLKSVWSVWSMFSPHFEHFDFVWDCCSASIAGWQGVDAGLAGRHLRWRNAHLHCVIFREVSQVLTFIYILHCLHPNLTCVFYWQTEHRSNVQTCPGSVDSEVNPVWSWKTAALQMRPELVHWTCPQLARW